MKSRKVFFLLLLVSSSTFGLAFAQDERPNRRDLVLESGSPDSFQNNVKFLGEVATDVVLFSYDCGPVNEGVRCVVLNPAPELTDFDVRDIGRITLPGNSAKNLIYEIANYTVRYELENTTSSPQPTAGFSFLPYLTIESAALNDPRAVDGFGDPLNGRLDYIPEAGLYIRDRSLAVGERDFQDIRYTRAQVEGLSKALFRSYDIPSDIVDRMFREPMTIRLNFFGTAKLVSMRTRVNYNMRLLGN